MILLRQRGFSSKKSREELEDEYNKESKKLQKKVSSIYGIGVGAPSAAAGALLGGDVGEGIGSHTKPFKQAVASHDAALKKLGLDKSAKKALSDSEKAIAKVMKPWRRAGYVVGAAGIGYGGYKLGKGAVKSASKRADKKFLENATDEEVEEATEKIKKATSKYIV